MELGSCLTSTNMFIITAKMTGSVDKDVDMGLMPRTVSAIFAEIGTRGDCQSQVLISVLEIVNETGYDLLDPERAGKAPEHLRKV